MPAGRDQSVAHPARDTIKVLLALVALDELDLNSTVVADVADTLRPKPRRRQTAQLHRARQLLDGLLLVSGNDAANTLAHMLVAKTSPYKMNAKAATLGATSTHATTPSGLDGPGGSGASTAHDLVVIFRQRWPIRCSRRSPPSLGDVPQRTANSDRQPDELLQRYLGAIGGKTGYN